jgi:hypothetical protein
MNRLDPTELPPRLLVQGPDILKPNGMPWLGRGVSFGSWGEDQAIDLDQLQDMKGNSVRILLRTWGLYGTPDIDSRDDLAFSFLKRANVQHFIELVVNAAARGQWVIAGIDSNCGQSGTQNPETVRYCDPYGTWGARGHNFITDSTMGKWFAIIWQTIARVLRPISHIAMLELLPEPLDGRDAQWSPALRTFLRKLIGSVREVDADTPFLLGARGGYDINYCDEAWLEERNDVIYTGNLLSGWVTNREKFDAGLGKLIAMRDRRQVPIYVQQLGRKTGDDRDLNHMRHALQAVKDNHVGAAWWQWKQNTTNALEYALNYKDGDGGWVQKADEVALLTESWQA